MTAFGRGIFDLAGRRYRVELRSVNSRFLDLKLRHPWNDAELDHHLAQRIRTRVQRGRVDLNVTVEKGGGAESMLVLDVEVAEQVATALDALAAILGGDRTLAARLVTPPHDLLVAASPPAEDRRSNLLVALDAALDALITMREREGKGLYADLRDHLGEVERWMAAIGTRARDEPGQAQRRLGERLVQLGAGEMVDPQRLAQEVALVADRCDVSEELARLEIHARQFEEMIEAKDPVGRKLEFMLQELNRELNTIASKTGDAEAGTLVVEAKATLEKMREQVQNVE